MIIFSYLDAYALASQSNHGRKLMTVKTAKINVENLKPMARFVGSPSNPKFFFTMTEINKVGINPGSTVEACSVTLAIPR